MDGCHRRLQKMLRNITSRYLWYGKRIVKGDDFQKNNDILDYI